jgi:hypothetical protein
LVEPLRRHRLPGGVALRRLVGPHPRHRRIQRDFPLFAPLQVRSRSVQSIRQDLRRHDHPAGRVDQVHRRNNRREAPFLVLHHPRIHVRRRDPRGKLRPRPLRLFPQPGGRRRDRLPPPLRVLQRGRRNRRSRVGDPNLKGVARIPRRPNTRLRTLGGWPNRCLNRLGDVVTRGSGQGRARQHGSRLDSHVPDRRYPYSLKHSRQSTHGPDHSRMNVINRYVRFQPAPQGDTALQKSRYHWFCLQCSFLRASC